MCVYSNTNIISQGIGHDLAEMIDTIMCVIGSLIVIFAIDWKLSLCMIWIVPLMLGGCHIFAKVCFSSTELI